MWSLISRQRLERCQFTSVTQSYPTLCDPVGCSMPGSPVPHELLNEPTQHEPTQTHVIKSVMPSSHLIFHHSPFSCRLQSFPESRSFSMSQFFTSGSQSTGVSASAPVFSMKIQDWFPLGWTGWIPLLSKGLSRIFPNTTVRRHQFFSSQPSLWSIHMWLLKTPSVQHSSVAQLYPTLCDPMDCSTPGFPVHHQLLEPTQTHVHQFSDAIQP